MLNQACNAGIGLKGHRRRHHHRRHQCASSSSSSSSCVPRNLRGGTTCLLGVSWHSRANVSRLQANASDDDNKNNNEGEQAPLSVSAPSLDVRALDALIAPSGNDTAVDAAAEDDAISMVSTLPLFGAKTQAVPKRDYTLAELRLNNVEASRFLSPTDQTLNATKTRLGYAALAALAATTFTFHLSAWGIFGLASTTLFLLTADAVALNGAASFVLIDTAARTPVIGGGNYADRVLVHEAGHFLVAYTTGLLPKRYTLTALDALRKAVGQRLAAFGTNAPPPPTAALSQAGTEFCDGAFARETAAGSISSATLDTVSNVALAGIAAEYVVFGQAEGGVDDIAQLDGLFRSLGFTQKRADSQVRWSVLNSVTILRECQEEHRRLMDAMRRGATVAECIAAIENM